MLRIFRGERHSAPAAKSTDGVLTEDKPPESPEAQSPTQSVNGHSSAPPALESSQASPTAQQEATPANEAAPATEQHDVATTGPQEEATASTAQHDAASPAEQAPPADEQSGPPGQGAAAGQAPPEELPSDPGFLQRGRMRRRARFLRAARELAYRDLGGLMFDLHRFGGRNDEVVQAKLATLGRIDAELRAIEEALRLRSPVTVLREAGVAACPRCAAIHGSDDRFCPACGLPVTQAERPIGAASAPAPTPPAPIATPPFHQHLPPPMPATAPPQYATPPGRQQIAHHGAVQQPSPYQQQQPSPYQQPLPGLPQYPQYPQQPLPQPSGAAPAPAQIHQGAYPALPAAPAMQPPPPPGAPGSQAAPPPGSALGATPAAGPAPAGPAPGAPPDRPQEPPTEVVSQGGAETDEQRTRAFYPVAPFGAPRQGEGGEHRRR